MKTYKEFLRSKAIRAEPCGRSIDESDIHEMLFPFQKALVRWAVRKGRCAIFADCGLGKTLMQLEWARLVGGRCLIIAPLSVIHQTRREAEKIGISITEQRKVRGRAIEPFNITNYERISALL